MKKKTNSKAGMPDKKPGNGIDTKFVLAVVSALQWDLDIQEVKDKIIMFEAKNGYDHMSILGAALFIKKLHDFPSCINPAPAPVKTGPAYVDKTFEQINQEWLQKEEERKEEEARAKKEAEDRLWLRLTPDEQKARRIERLRSVEQDARFPIPTEEEFEEMRRQREADENEIFKF